MYEKKNLVFLRFTSNVCYVEVVEEKPKDVTLNLEAGMWSWHGGEYKIGDNRPRAWGQEQTIGVYDRTKLSHLNAMVQAASEVTRPSGSVLDD